MPLLANELGKARVLPYPPEGLELTLARVRSSTGALDHALDVKRLRERWKALLK